MDNFTKLRPLFVEQILKKNTDDEHMMNIVDILQHLHDEYGIDSYRATIANDIELLQKAGIDIEFVKKSQNWYHYLDRDFDIAELKVIVDAIESARFISKDKSRDLVAKVSQLAGPFASEKLRRNVDVERRIKAGSDNIFYIVDRINEAINHGKQICFQYFDYNVKKEQKLRHDGAQYKMSPYRLVWNGDFYYVVGFYEKYDTVVSFRVDRIYGTPEISEEDRIPLPDGFDLDKHLDTMFRMFTSERKLVTLVCANDVMDSIIDRFGPDVVTYAYDMENFKAEVEVACNNVFYSWVFGFGGKVKIKAPEDVAEAYKKMVRSVAEKL